MFPEQVVQVLDSFGVVPATKAVLLELYLQLGADVLEVFAEIAERFESPSRVQPEDIRDIRATVVALYLRRNHPLWLALRPTESFYYQRLSQGRAAGLVKPLGKMDDREGFALEVAKAVRRVLEESQPVPKGVLLMGKNAHSGGRDETVSFDIVADDLSEAMEVALATGQQHTIPGSVGETSSTFDPARRIALIWEVQPNVYKPNARRNSALSKIWRHNRNWHVATLAAAVYWYLKNETATFVLRGEALRATHELNPFVPLPDRVIELYEKTVRCVIAGMGGTLELPNGEESVLLKESGLMNTSLRKLVEDEGAAAAVFRVEISHSLKEGLYGSQT